MKITKVYETLLNISAAEMFQDIDEVIMMNLRKNFEGRNRSKSFVTKVNKILQRSQCVLDKSKSDGSGRVSVRFTADAIIFAVDDILPRCEILRIEKQQIICKYDEYTIVVIKGDRNMPMLKAGDLIPAIVRRTSYLQEKLMVTVFADLYRGASPGTLVYIVATDKAVPTAEELVILQKREAELADVIKAYEEVVKTADNNEMLETIENAYYPYKKSPESILSSIKFAAILDALPAAADGGLKAGAAYSRPPFISKSTSTVLEFDKKSNGLEILNRGIFTGPVKTVQEPTITIRLAFIEDQLQFLQMVTAMLAEPARYSRSWSRTIPKPTSFN